MLSRALSFRPPSILPTSRSARGDTQIALERRTVAVGTWVAAGVVSVQSVAHVVNLVAFDLRIDAVDADSDSSAFAWASSVATFGAALLLAQLALLAARRRALLAALAVALAFLSLDDALGLHERLSATEFAGIEHFARVFWPLAFMPLLAGCFVGLWALAPSLQRPPRRLLLSGLGLLAAAIALEMTSPALFAVGFDHGELGYELEVVLEEGAELAGWILIAAALVALVFEGAGSARDAPGSAGPALGPEAPAGLSGERAGDGR